MWRRFLLCERMLKILARDDSEDGSWYCSMFRCFSFRTLPGKARPKNSWTGFRSGLDPAIRTTIVYPSPNLRAEKRRPHGGSSENLANG